MSHSLINGRSLGQVILPSNAVFNVFFVISAALFIALLAQLKFFMAGNPVPITGQTLGVLFIAGFFGRVRAVVAVLLYIVLGAAGLPFFAVATSLTNGYLVGFVLAVYWVGFLAENGFDRSFIKAMPAFLLGYAIIYCCGVLGLTVYFGFSKAFYLGFYAFIPVILIKTVILAIIFPVAWRCRSAWHK